MWLRKESKAHIDRTFFNSLGLGIMEQLLLSVKIWGRSPFVCLRKWQMLVCYFFFCEHPMFIVSAGAKLSLHTTRQKLLWLPTPDTNEVKALPKYYIYFERHTERESDRYIGCIEPPPLISLKKKKKREGRHPFRFLTRRGGQVLTSYLCRDVAVMARKRCYITFSEKKKEERHFVNILVRNTNKYNSITETVTQCSD